MPISLDRECVDQIPPLAWIAVLPTGSETVRLLHGRHVEQFAAGFFEGAWDNAFADADFEIAANVFGSGGKFSEEAVTFVAPSHTLEPIYIAQTTRITAVSNSLPFLLHYCDLKLDVCNYEYGAIFSSIVYGLDNTPQSIALSGGT